MIGLSPWPRLMSRILEAAVIIVLCKYGAILVSVALQTTSINCSPSGLGIISGIPPLSSGGIGMVTVLPICEKNEFQNLVLLEDWFQASWGDDAVITRIGFLGNFFIFCCEIKDKDGSHARFSRTLNPSLAISPDPPGVSGVLTATILSINTGTLERNLWMTSI